MSTLKSTLAEGLSSFEIAVTFFKFKDIMDEGI